MSRLEMVRTALAIVRDVLLILVICAAVGLVANVAGQLDGWAPADIPVMGEQECTDTYPEALPC